MKDSPAHFTAPIPEPSEGADMDQEINRDLGFGSVVASESRQRLFNRDGTFNVVRTGLSFWTSISLYHTLLNVSWPIFLSMLAGVYTLTNVVFAGFYTLCGARALDGPEEVVFGSRFLRTFFFSVETFSTIGYGNLTPRGLAANIVVTCEAFTGILFVALATGIIFARFSRPTAKFIFSNNAVIAPYMGTRALMFRITNARKTLLMDLTATVLFARFENVDGRILRRFYPLVLERDRVALLPLSWTVVHPISDDSPLKDLTEQDFTSTNAEVLIVIKGTDETFSQQVHTRTSYQASEIVWNARFGDIYDRRQDSGLLTVDIRKLHDIERL